jgi:DNA primase
MSELNEFIDELHSKVDIVNVIGRYVKLKKQGINFVGLCPFHHEKTPSFVVSPSKQLFHCFGCGAGGDVVKFIMMIEGTDFKETVSILAKEAGLAPPKFEKGSSPKEDKDEIKNVNNFATDFFHSMLNENIRTYLRKRGLSNSSIEKYRFGFADENSNKLIFELNKQGVETSLLIKAGLFKKDPEGNLKAYFFNRIIIPIFDINGKVIAFSGRSIDGKEPKYLNSPETEVFSKSKVLYPLNFSKNAIRDAKSAIIVEGYFDAIILQQEGIGNVVSSMGTSFTEDQAKLIKRYADKIYFFYDNDTGGRLGAERAVEVCGKFDLNIGIVLSNENMDPDEIIIRDGKEAIENLLKTAKDPVLFIADFEAKKIGDTPLGKAQLSQKLLDIVSKISNKTTVYEYIRKLSNLLDLDTRLLIDQYNKMILPAKSNKKEPLTIKTNKIKTIQEILTQAILQKKDTLSKITESIDLQTDLDEPYKKIFLRALKDIEKGKEPDPKTWYDMQEDEISTAVELLLKDPYLVRDDVVLKAIDSLRNYKIYHAYILDLYSQINELSNEDEKLVKLKEYNDALRKLKGR